MLKLYVIIYHQLSNHSSWFCQPKNWMILLISIAGRLCAIMCTIVQPVEQF